MHASATCAPEGVRCKPHPRQPCASADQPCAAQEEHCIEQRPLRHLPRVPMRVALPLRRHVQELAEDGSDQRGALVVILLVMQWPRLKEATQPELPEGSSQARLSSANLRRLLQPIFLHEAADDHGGALRALLSQVMCAEACNPHPLCVVYGSWIQRALQDAQILANADLAANTLRRACQPQATLSRGGRRVRDLLPGHGSRLKACACSREDLGALVSEPLLARAPVLLPGDLGDGVSLRELLPRSVDLASPVPR
mmetsp:Transcript_74997/g.233686  ORF Transcript_74997/g.233686 Transcript_74997/m.233686 type:complete len:255 (-) Transcript_74997:982-1746(-)